MDKNNIIIFCPANAATGGPELLHQLCYWLRKLNYNAYMYYINYNSAKNNSPVAKEYVCYKLPFILNYIDSVDNICVVPEVFSEYLYIIKKGLKIFWWMSVDNYYANTFAQHCNGDVLYDIWDDNNIIHFVQSYYAYEHCVKNGISKGKIYYLSDYIQDLFVKNAKNEINCKKNDCVLYNPKKGYEFTFFLIQRCTSIQWRPLINMSSVQLSNLMKHSKIYVDFGNHPGKDRMPREAAISGCCILIGNRGAAKFKEDINIPDEFRFENEYSNITSIINKIQNILQNYSTERKKFIYYKKDIIVEKRQFVKSVDYIFKELVS